jgi:threonine dehydrogenase-like Zn-dependent dehydrogenase
MEYHKKLYTSVVQKEDPMKGIMFDFKMSKIILMQMHLLGHYSLLKYKSDWPMPEIAYPHQVRVKTLMGGICATDLHMASLNISTFASILGGGDGPSPMGHEAIAKVVETGDGVKGLMPGDRVVYFPAISCDILGFKPCSSCKNGNLENCYSLAGVGDGTDREKMYGGEGNFGGWGGGGFCEFLTGFEKQFFKVPQSVPDEAAVLVEPFSVALHGVARNLPSKEQNVLVIGAGTIGLMIVAALRSYGSGCRIITLARYPFQASAAKQLGSDDVIVERDRNLLYEEVAERTGARLFKPIMGKRAVFGDSGPDMIFDSIGSESSLDDGLHLIRSNGRIVIIGQAYAKTKKVDWSIQTWKEIEIVGSLMYGMEPYKGKTLHCFELALHLLKQNPGMFEGIVTHTFAVDDYKKALDTARVKKKSHAIKAAFDYRPR